MIIPQYYKQINTSMTDFEDFYKSVAKRLPNKARICEVGVADGKSSLMLADFMHSEGKEFTLVMVDSCDYGGKNQAHDIWTNIIQSGYKNIEFLHMGSLDASCKFNDGYFDFVFIDASHEYEPTKADIRLWWHKVKDEGLLAGHDYFGHEQVRSAVDELIPVSVTRSDIVGRIFEPEEVLVLMETHAGCGVWSVEKKHYVKLLN